MSFDPELIAQVQRSSSALTDEIEAARTAGVAAIRSIETRLVEALGGTLLRGLPDLAGDLRNTKLAAARVRGKREQPLAEDAPAVLVITAEGTLNMAIRMGGAIRTAPALDVELNAEDLQSYTNVLTEVLKAHLAKAADLHAKFAGIRELAERLKEAVEQ